MKTFKKIKLNQHASRRRGARGAVFVGLLVLSLLMVMAIRQSQYNFITAYRGSYDTVPFMAEAKEPTPTPTATPMPEPTPTELEEIVAYITRVFEKEGKHMVVWAINCFYSESGLRTEAVNKGNSNGTIDYGVAQVNSIHNYSPELLHTIKGNIDAAYEIYQRQGTKAWYGSRCN